MLNEPSHLRCLYYFYHFSWRFQSELPAQKLTGWFDSSRNTHTRHADPTTVAMPLPLPGLPCRRSCRLRRQISSFQSLSSHRALNKRTYHRCYSCLPWLSSLTGRRRLHSPRWPHTRPVAPCASSLTITAAFNSSLQLHSHRSLRWPDGGFFQGAAA